MMPEPNDDDHADKKSIPLPSATSTDRVKDTKPSTTVPADADASSSTAKAQAENERPALDEFGLPIRPLRKPITPEDSSSDEQYDSAPEDVTEQAEGKPAVAGEQKTETNSKEAIEGQAEPLGTENEHGEATKSIDDATLPKEEGRKHEHGLGLQIPKPSTSEDEAHLPTPAKPKELTDTVPSDEPADERPQAEKMVLPEHLDAPIPTQKASEWSHQQVVPQKVDADDDKKAEDEWQEMPAFAPYNLYDDNGKLIAKEAADSDEEAAAYSGLGGAGKGYTRVNIDEDAQSATSMDENTKYLFKEPTTDAVDDDEEARDAMAQMQATKDLLNEQQKIAYVGVTRVAMSELVKAAEDIEGTRATRKELRVAAESMKMWSQKMMVRLYAHMEISSAGTSDESVARLGLC